MKPQLPLCCTPAAHSLMARQLSAIHSPDALLEGAVAISMHQMEDIDLHHVDRTLQSFADTVRSRVRGSQPQAMLAHLHEFLDAAGFHDIDVAVVARVGISGVDEADAGVECGVDGADRALLVGTPIERHGHLAQADRMVAEGRGRDLLPWGSTAVGGTTASALSTPAKIAPMNAATQSGRTCVSDPKRNWAIPPPTMPPDPPPNAAPNNAVRVADIGTCSSVVDVAGPQSVYRQTFISQRRHR